MRLFLLVLACLALCGCVPPTSVTTNTMTFHDLHGPLKGETFVIVPTKQQEGDLEFNTYVPLLRQQLLKVGMVEAPFAQAKYSVFLYYSIDNGRTVVESRPIYNISGGNTTYSTGTAYGPGGTVNYTTSTYHPVTINNAGSSTSSYVQYMRKVNVDFLNIEASVKQQNPVKVYELRAASAGTNGQIGAVMPAILRSMFKGFPSPSGSSATDSEPLQLPPK